MSDNKNGVMESDLGGQILGDATTVDTIQDVLEYTESNNNGVKDSPENASRGFAITALVCGIVALITCVFGVISIPAGLVAILFGVMALAKKQSKPMAIWGLVTGTLGIVISLLIVIIAMFFITTYSEEITKEMNNVSSEISGSDGTAVKAFDVDVIVSAPPGSSVLYTAPNGKVDDFKLDSNGLWSTSDSMKTGSNLTVVVSNESATDDSELSCSIEVDGEVVSSDDTPEMSACAAIVGK